MYSKSLQEINSDGTLLLFRDKRQRLYLNKLNHKAKPCLHNTKSLLLEKCQFAQWILESDAAVAQNESSLVVWYDVEDMEARQTYKDIGNARVETIQRYSEKSGRSYQAYWSGLSLGPR